MSPLDATHDPALQSWVQSANGHAEFPIQNLPLGIFSPKGGTKRVGVAIGDSILDLAALPDLELGSAVKDDTLNALLGLGTAARQALRVRLSALLAEGSANRIAAEPALHDATECDMHLPAAIGDYTDFYVGIHHATNIGKVFRPDNPLLPNYKHVPIGYHGRASSVRVSGTPVRRPKGQLKAPDSADPVYAPCRRLDYELELGVWVGPGNELGETIPLDEAASHIGGYCLLNDWSARDIQAWEYQPLGPFLAKNFGSTISPWVITPEAMAPFTAAQQARPEGDPKPLPYLWSESDQQAGGARHRTRCPAPDARITREGLAPASAIPVAHQAYVLDRRPDGDAPHERRLRSASGGPFRLRHTLGPPMPAASAACWRSRAAVSTR